ncbi:MAG: response regulator [bacterium]
MSPRILVIDDEEQICNYLSELFKLEGWSADIAYDGYEGVRLASDQEYDVIIMDILMPRLTGIEATKEIIRRKPNSKIVVITGAPYHKQAEDALSYGAKSFVKKPFSPQKIIQVVKQLI